MDLIIVLDQTHHVLVFKEANSSQPEQYVLPDSSILTSCQEKCIHFKHFVDSSRFQDIDKIDIYIFPAFINPCFPDLDGLSISYEWIPIWIFSEEIDLSPISGKILQDLYSHVVLEGYFPENFAFEVWYFGMDESLANALGNLVVEGKKTATASYYDLYALEGEKLPQIGDVSVIVNWPGIPLAIIETTDIQIVPFDQVSAEHAAQEGEGNLSLAYWRQAHEKFFKLACKVYDKEFSTSAKVVCQKFHVIKKLNV